MNKELEEELRRHTALYKSIIEDIEKHQYKTEREIYKRYQDKCEHEFPHASGLKEITLIHKKCTKCLFVDIGDFYI